MKKGLSVLFVLAALTLAACSGGASSGSRNAQTSEPPAPVPAEYAGKTNPLGADAATAGAEVFNSNCTACHGTQGYGDGPAAGSLDPAPKNLPELGTVVGDDYLFWRISTGRPGTAMVAWKGILTDEQIWQVVSYIRTLK